MESGSTYKLQRSVALKPALNSAAKNQAANKQNLKWRFAEPTRYAEAAMRQLLLLAPLPLPSRGFSSHPHDSNQSDRNKRYNTAKFYKRLAGRVADGLTGCLALLMHQGHVLLGQNKSQTRRNSRTNRSVGIGIGIVLFAFGIWQMFAILRTLAKTPFALLICVHYRPAARRQILLPTLCV